MKLVIVSSSFMSKLERNGTNRGIKSDKIKRRRMEEGDGGIIDMTGRRRRGDKRCGSSILRVSSAWRGCSSM